VAHRTKRLAGGVECGAHFRVDGNEPGRANCSEAKLARADLDGVNEAMTRRGRPVGVAVGRTGHHVEQQRRVADRAGERSVGGEPAPPFAHHGSVGDAPARGLDPDQPTARCGQPDGTAAVAPLGDRMHPGGDGRGRSAAGAACRMGRIPGIARGRAEPAVGRRFAAELGGGGLAQQDTARGHDSRGVFLVGARHEILEALRAEGRADTLGPGEVLERIGDAEEGHRGAIGAGNAFQAGRILERAVGGDGHEGAKPRIEAIDTLEEELGDFARPDFLFEHEFAQFPSFDPRMEHLETLPGVSVIVAS